MTDRVKPLVEHVRAYIADAGTPLESDFFSAVNARDRWQLSDRQQEILEGLKNGAREKGLWNFFLTDSADGYGLNTVEYAYLAEEMGHSHLASEVFNCSAPDTGNMEVLARYGSDEQKARWLKPLLNGEIRSAYAMTEPGVASSDATNISMSAVLENGEWLINGEKFYISGAGDARCRLMICMVRTDPQATRHQQHSQILIPMDAPGVKVLRPMQVFSQKPRKIPVQDRAKVTWNVILDAAAQVLLRRGYEKATTDRIAERAGVSIGSVYEYFPNKESIFAALMLRFNEERWTALSAIQTEEDLQEEDVGLAAMLRVTVRARIAATRLNPKLNSALNLEVPHHVSADQGKAMFKAFLRLSLEKLSTHQDELREADHELMAEFVIHATHAIVDNVAASSPERLASQEFEDELTLMMYRYFAK